MQVCNQNDGQELKNDTCVYVDNYVEIGDFSKVSIHMCHF